MIFLLVTHKSVAKANFNRIILVQSEVSGSYSSTTALVPIYLSTEFSLSWFFLGLGKKELKSDLGVFQSEKSGTFVCLNNMVV